MDRAEKEELKAIRQRLEEFQHENAINWAHGSRNYTHEEIAVRLEFILTGNEPKKPS